MSCVCDNKCDDCTGEACACDDIEEEVLPIYNRLMDWLKFNGEMVVHIRDYTIPQYGDRPDDLLTKWSAEDCLVAAEKYLNRRHTNVRDDKMRDLLKCVHYIQVAYKKLGKTVNPQ